MFWLHLFPKTYEKTVALYITDVLAKYPKLRPVATEAFGGALKDFRLPVSRKMDPAKVKLWAEELGKKFKE